MTAFSGHRHVFNILAAIGAAGWLMAGSWLFAGDLTFGGRNWKTNDQSSDVSYSVVNDTGVIANSQYARLATMATPITIAIGDVISYDYTVTNPGSNNWIGSSFGDFRGGNMLATQDFTGYLISGRVGYQQDFAPDRALRFQDAGFNENSEISQYYGGTEDSPGIHVTWWFPTANNYKISVANIGSGSHVLTSYYGTTGGNPVTAITYFRQNLDDTLQTATISNFTQAAAGAAGSLRFSFEGSLTADGFKNLSAPGSRTNWTSTASAVDIGSGFSLLPATHGSYRVVIAPYGDRDGFGNANDLTQVLRSPTFQLNGSGSLQVDMVGGMSRGENKSLAGNAETDPLNVGQLGSKHRNPDFDFGGAGEVNDGKHIEAFALRDALTGEYVLVGSSASQNDGKTRSTDAYQRGVWDTAVFTAQQLAPFANNGRRYEVDFFDSYGASSWGWIGFDNLRVPGALSSFQKGDTNGDNIVDSNDSSAVFGNFTGSRSASPVAKPDALARINGDFDGNGDVDGGDVIEHIANIGLTAPTAGTAKLIYDPSDGSVSLSATGAAGNNITTFRLLSASNVLASGVAAFPSSAGPLSTDLTSELFWADTALAGFSGIHDLGSILASGLTLTGVQQALSSAMYVGTAGTGAFNFNIILALTGDYNSDGKVDGADYIVWRKTGINGPQGYTDWRTNFGATSGSGTAGGSLTTGAVPEPSSLALCGLLFVTLIASRQNNIFNL